MAKLSDVIGGLTILAKYAKGGLDSHSIAAEHDIIYGPGPEEVSEEDRKALESLHWHWDEEVDSWARFV